MPTNLSDLSLVQLKRAVQIKEQIAQLEAQLATITGGATVAKAAPKASGMSAATKAKLSAIAKARWAKIKGNKPAQATSSKAPARKKMSPAQRAKIAAVMKARWAKAKASGKSSL